MKFKKSEFGRSLDFEDSDGVLLQADAYDDAKGDTHFLILWTEDGRMAGMTRKEARKFAMSILKELAR